MKNYRTILSKELEILNADSDEETKRNEGLKKAEDGLEMRRNRTTGIGIHRRRSVSQKRSLENTSPDKKDIGKQLKQEEALVTETSLP